MASKVHAFSLTEPTKTIEVPQEGDDAFLECKVDARFKWCDFIQDTRTGIKPSCRFEYDRDSENKIKKMTKFCWQLHTRTEFSGDYDQNNCTMRISNVTEKETGQD